MLKDAGALVAVLALWITVGLVAYGEGKGDRSTDARQVTTATGIEFQAPPELAGSPPPSGVLEALAITPLRVYSPAGDVTQGSVVVGYSRGTGPTLLGSSAARLAADSAPQVEEVGEYVAVRVAGTVVDAGARNRVIVYSVPTTGGDAVVLCIGARDGVIVSLRSYCERVATKLKIAPTSLIGRPISLGQLVAYPHSLLETVTFYADAASVLRRRLKEAKYSGEERGLTAQLASLYGHAARALAPAHLDPLALPAQRSLYKGIKRVRAGYALLTRAAASGGSGAWALGRSQVASAEGIIAVALHRILAE